MKALVGDLLRTQILVSDSGVRSFPSPHFIFVECIFGLSWVSMVGVEQCRILEDGYSLRPESETAGCYILSGSSYTFDTEESEQWSRSSSELLSLCAILREALKVNDRKYWKRTKNKTQPKVLGMGSYGQQSKTCQIVSHHILKDEKRSSRCFDHGV